MSVTAVSTAPPSVSGPHPRGLRANPWLTLVAVAFGLFMVGLDGSVVSIANAEIARDLNASTAELARAVLLTPSRLPPVSRRPPRR